MTTAGQNRSALLLFSPDFGLAGVEEAAAIIGDALGWDDERRSREIEAYRSYADEHKLPAD